MLYIFQIIFLLIAGTGTYYAVSYSKKCEVEYSKEIFNLKDRMLRIEEQTARMKTELEDAERQLLRSELVIIQNKDGHEISLNRIAELNGKLEKLINATAKKPRGRPVKNKS